MILISHRGNLNGRIPERENSLEYIDEAIDMGFYVEIDVRTKENDLYLGHDEPQYLVTLDWLNERSEFLYIHVKDFKSLDALIMYNNLKIFFHTLEEHVIINNTKVFWSHDIKNISEKSIIPLLSLDEIKLNSHLKNNVFGICSDYIIKL
jgi:glycerophosphoryl diester phosphodiesterase